MDVKWSKVIKECFFVGEKVMGLVEKFKEYGEDFIVVDILFELVVGMNVLIGEDLINEYDICV